LTLLTKLGREAIHFYKINLFKIQVNTKSNAPKKPAITKLKTTTAPVYLVVCCLVGQFTRPNSSFTSFKKFAIEFMLFIVFKNPRGGKFDCKNSIALPYPQSQQKLCKTTIKAEKKILDTFTQPFPIFY